MESKDFYEEGDGQVITRADKYMWCQSHTMSILQVSDMSFSFLNTQDVTNSKFLFQIKIGVPEGNLIYEYKFNNTHSHSFRQSGGRTWSNAFDNLGSPRILKLGVTNDITFKRESRDWIMSVNGFRYVKIKGIYNPNDMIISLTYPANELQLASNKVYQSDFVRFKSVFSEIKLNGEDFQPKTIRCYVLNLNSNKVTNLKISKPLEFLNVKSLADLNIEELNKDPPLPEPVKPDPPEEKVKHPDPSPEPLKPVPPVPKPSDNNDKPGESDKIKPNPTPSPVDIPIKPGNVSDINFSVKSNIKGIERHRLFNLEIEDIFKKCVDYYVKLGFGEDQAELIIFQMGVSFCTSKNSIGDLTSHLIWEDSKGKLIRLRKSDHVKYMNSLTKFSCNVERLVLRYYSEKILNLLKNGSLVPASHHAKRRGVKQEFAYLVTDFFDYGKLKLSDQELQVLNSDMQYVLLKNKHRRSIVNVNQLY